MEFLVEFEVKVPTGVPEAEVEQREEAEAAAAANLFDQGHLERLWRVSAAQSGNSILGLYSAANGAELNDLLSALPMSRVDGSRRDTPRSAPQRSTAHESGDSARG